jgi:toxin ParE1/3/4
LKVRVSSRADSDLERIGDVISLDNPHRAVSFVRELRGKCKNLGSHPFAYPAVDHRPETGLRRRVHGNYLIFYRVLDGEVVIVRILHGAMDYQRLLFPDEER